MRIYSQNPMTYASVLDVNIYIKRDFAPLEDRVRSITSYRTGISAPKDRRRPRDVNLAGESSPSPPGRNRH